VADAAEAVAVARGMAVSGEGSDDGGGVGASVVRSNATSSDSGVMDGITVAVGGSSVGSAAGPFWHPASRRINASNTGTHTLRSNLSMISLEGHLTFAATG